MVPHNEDDTPQEYISSPRKVMSTEQDDWIEERGWSMQNKVVLIGGGVCGLGAGGDNKYN